MSRILDLTAKLAQRFLGPNPKDYAEGYEDCRKEIATLLDLTAEYVHKVGQNPTNYSTHFITKYAVAHDAVGSSREKIRERIRVIRARLQA